MLPSSQSILMRLKAPRNGHRSTVLETLRRGSLLAVVMLLATACSGDDHTAWTEEVLSHDGTVFTLEGEGVRRGGGFPTAHRGSIAYQSYFHRPSGAYWRAPGIIRPDIFELIDGVPHVILILQGSLICEHFGYPDNSLAAFRWSYRSGWQRVAISFPLENWHMNVLYQVFSARDRARDVKGHVSIEFKESRDRKIILKDWVRDNGAFCSSKRTGGRQVNDRVIPNLSGFHTRPDN